MTKLVAQPVSAAVAELAAFAEEAGFTVRRSLQPNGWAHFAIQLCWEANGVTQYIAVGDGTEPQYTEIYFLYPGAPVFTVLTTAGAWALVAKEQAVRLEMKLAALRAELAAARDDAATTVQTGAMAWVASAPGSSLDYLIGVYTTEQEAREATSAPSADYASVEVGRTNPIDTDA